MKITKQAAWRLLLDGIPEPETTMYVSHCRYVGDLAGKIAAALGKDADYAAGLGYLHDIGRKLDSPNHVYAGWEHLTALGLEEYAGVCLTHSFLENEITNTCARVPDPNGRGYAQVKKYVETHENTFYDRLIQLCDLLCMHTGPVSLNERIEDIQSRKGTHPGSAKHRACAEKLLDSFNAALQMQAGTMVQCQYEAVRAEHQILPERILVAVDLQNDFVNGALGSPEAVAAANNAAKRIAAFGGSVIATLDTHTPDYLFTAEGRKLPVPHCIEGAKGYEFWPPVAEALTKKRVITVKKPTFGAVTLPQAVLQAAGGREFSLEVLGLCTDICVVSNALLLKAHFPEAAVSVNAACCAGVTPEKHLAALETMRSCQIDVI